MTRKFGFRIIARLLIMAPLLLLALPVQAATIRVEGSCGLRNAIIAANSDRANDFCPAGSGHDTIVLTWDVALTSELPKISSAITIEGGGHFISGQDKRRIFFVDEAGDLTIKDATLKDGHAIDGGLECRPADFDSDWDGFDESGGAICNLGDLTIHGSSFSGNSARVGGAIDSWGEASISESSFSGNSAENSGGAIRSEGEASISYSSFSGNSADNNGGAITNSRTGSLSVSESSFSGNSADYGGAIINTGAVSISGSSFSGNSADELGGAIGTLGGSATIRNTTITGNSAGTGGGIRVGLNDEYTATLHLRDSIIADNSGGDCSIEQHSTPVSSRNNYIKDGSCDATWSGSDARQRDGYCPASQLRDGVCQIGADSSPSQPSDPPAAQPAQSAPEPAQSERPGTITVGGDCALADAITASNRKQAYRGCPAGDGRIRLSGDITLSNPLPDINSDVIIDGAGHSISGAGEYEILHVNAHASLTIKDLTLADGQVGMYAEPWTRAGALTNKGSATIISSRFINNRGTAASAINNHLGASLVIESSSFSGNRSDDNGAAVANDRGRMQIVNSTLTGNLGGFALSGGAPDDYVVISNSAIVKNAGGISFMSGSASLRNSIIADNKRGDCRGRLHEDRLNIIQDGSCDASASIDPLLGRLIQPAKKPLYYRLTEASPGIDQADGGYCPAVDALGVERPQGAGCDIGPVEYRGIEPAPWALRHSSLGAMTIADLACTDEQSYFVLSLRKAELGREAAFKVTLEAVDGASLAHVMPVPVVRSGWEFAQEVAVDLAMYAANLTAAEFYTKIPGSSLVVSGATKVSALVRKYHEWDAEQEKLERQSLGMFRATLYAESSDIDFLVHASHAGGGQLLVTSDWWDYSDGDLTREFARVAPCQ